MIKEKLSFKRRFYIVIMRALMYICTSLTACLVLALVVYLLIKGIPNLSWEFLTSSPSYLTGRIGILPDILNTIYIMIAALIVVIPLGIGSAVYLTEYAKNKRIVSIIEYAIGNSFDNLWFSRNAIFLSVSRNANLASSRCFDFMHNESSNHHENNPREP